MVSIADEKLIHEFGNRYGIRTPRLFYAPGRINLIGEHTDYNEGFVLPFAIDRGTTVAAAPREDRTVRAYSTNREQYCQFALDNTASPTPGHWATYIEGMARSLDKTGYRLGGADLLIASEVPLGGGLSSSAALEVSVGLALCQIAGHTPDPLLIVKAAHLSETQYVGTQSGIMDPFVSMFARKDSCLLIDCRALEYRAVPLMLGDYAVIVCDTKVRHNLASSEYNRRRAECQQGVELIKQMLPDIDSLRDINAGQFSSVEHMLPSTIRNRCRHVVTENARTIEAAQALNAGDFGRVGTLMFESHESLRRDYAVSISELDLLVDLAVRQAGVVGARMTGGGFGGCTVTLIKTRAIAEFTDVVSRTFSAAFRTYPAFSTPRPSDGAHEKILQAPPLPI